MKVSIITISYNNVMDIKSTIESVIGQSYSNIEYIIVDGASKDETIEVVRKYEKNIYKIISEPDKNLYDAINKGIKIATGDIVGLIHAGDRLYDNLVVEKIAGEFVNNDIDITYGHSKIVNQQDKAVRVNKSPKYKNSLVRWGWMPSHQSIYVRRELFNKYGYYRTDLGGIGDYEWFIRFFYSNQPRIKRLNKFIVKFAMGGISTRSYTEKLQKDHKNITKYCWELNGIKPPIGIVYLKWLRKPKQFLLAWLD